VSETEEKHCKWCRKPLVRKQYPGGLMEMPFAFRHRQFCDKKCSGWWNRTAVSRRPCKKCGTVLTRKRRPCGALEPLGNFLKRVYCDRKCMGDYYHLNKGA
jgi:hypothetical protein